MTSPTLPDSVELVLDMLKKGLGEDIKTYYDGDPGLIPQFNFPALMVTKTSDNGEPESNLEDDVTETLVITVALDKKDDWSEIVDPLNMTEKKLRRFMEARDPITKRWLPNTVKGAIRRGLDGDRRIGRRMSLELGVTPRSENLTTAEAQLTIEITYAIDVDQ